MTEIFRAAENGEIGQNILNWSMFLIFLGAAGKSAQVPFHVWLPDAMEGPTPVSALIHAATMVAAGVFLVAVLFPLYELTPFVLDLIAAIGVTTALGAAMIAVVMTDMKRILAYSTVSHLGFMMLALGAGEVGVAMFHLFAHAFAKAVLFLAAGSVNHGTGQTDVRKMGGLWRKMPITATTFTISALSLAGLPPLGGFFSKDEILRSVWDGRISGAYLIVALVAVVFSAIYTARIIYRVFFGPASDESANAHESPIAMIGPMVLLTAFGAVGGAIAFEWGNFGGLVGWVANEAGTSGIEFTVWLTVLSAALAIGFMAIVFRMHQAGGSTIPSIRRSLSPAQRLLENRFYFDELYQWHIDRVVMTASGVIGWFDRRAINDEGVDGPPNATGWWGREMRYLQTGRVYNSAAAMAGGAAVAVIIWWVQ